MQIWRNTQTDRQDRQTPVGFTEQNHVFTSLSVSPVKDFSVVGCEHVWPLTWPEKQNVSCVHDLMGSIYLTCYVMITVAVVYSTAWGNRVSAAILFCGEHSFISAAHLLFLTPGFNDLSSQHQAGRVLRAFVHLSKTSPNGRKTNKWEKWKRERTNVFHWQKILNTKNVRVFLNLISHFITRYLLWTVG